MTACIKSEDERFSLSLPLQNLVCQFRNCNLTQQNKQATTETATATATAVSLNR